MSGVNKVILVGRLGKDPEVKNANGLSICNFSVATSRQWKDDSGEKKEKTEWHNIVAFKKLADICGKFLVKGRQVYLEGELQTRSWEDQETGVKKYRTEIVARTVQFIGDNKPSDVNTEDGQGAPMEPQFDNQEDIPF